MPLRLPPKQRQYSRIDHEPNRLIRILALHRCKIADGFRGQINRPFCIFPGKVTRRLPLPN